MPLPKLEDLFTRRRRTRFWDTLNLSHFLICLLLIGVFILLLIAGTFESVEHSFLDTFFRQRPAASGHPDLVVIEIDQESLQTVGPWPWPWSYYAQMIEILHKWQAKAIVLDFLLSEENAPEQEAALQKVLAKKPPLYLPVSLESQSGKKFWIHNMPVALEPEHEKKAWNHSLKQVEQAAKGLGHRNIESDKDGVVRRVPPYLSYGGESYFYLPLKVAAEGRGISLTSRLDIKQPLDSRGNLLINWAGKWAEVFTHYSFSDLIRSAQALDKGMNPLISPEKIRGKICVIGITAKDLADLKVTPLESSAPSVGIQASVLHNALSGRYLIPASKQGNMLCLCLAGFLASVLFVIFGNVASFISGLLLAFAWIAAAFFLFVQKGIWIYSFYPLVLILMLFIFSAIYNQIRLKKEESRLFTLATRDGLTGLFVIRHFREILNQAVEEAREQGQPLSVILMDIDNFKKINDTYGHVAGDMILKKTAQVVHGCFRTQRPVHQVDFAARYGGEEFIVMVRNTDLKTAGLQVAERVRKAIEAAVFEWEGTVIPVTVSVGVATLRDEENIPDIMVRRADEALYRAKKAGKNRVCLETFAAD